MATMAIVWIGGGIMMQAFALRALAAKDGARMAEFSRDAEFIGMRLFTPASLVLLLTGALAAYVPARRASRADPVTALRAE